MDDYCLVVFSNRTNAEVKRFGLRGLGSWEMSIVEGAGLRLIGKI